AADLFAENIADWVPQRVVDRREAWDRGRRWQSPTAAQVAARLWLQSGVRRQVKRARSIHDQDHLFIGQRQDHVSHHLPVLDIDAHGSCLARASPFCSNSIETLSGERMNAMRPSRGGLLMVTPAFISRSQTA